MKDKLISIAGNGLPWGLGFFCLAFGVGRFLFNLPTEQSVKIALVICVCTWVFNGFIYSRFTRSFKQLQSISLEITSPEVLMLQTPANHLTEDSLVGGKLFLTNQRIIFKPHASYKLLPQIFCWNLQDIEPHKFYGTIFNAGGEFLMNTKDGASLMFEVDKLREWEAALYNAKKSIEGLMMNA